MALSAFASSILFHPLLNAFMLCMGLGLVEEHTLPDSMEIGSSVLATWTIDKGQTAGFARLQLRFPSGIVVEPIKTDGASFTFEDQKAKFIWMDIPAAPSIHVSLKLTANAKFSGGEVRQWFSFIEAGSRRDVEFEPHVISIEQSEDPILASSNSWDPQVARNFNMEESDIGQMTVEFSGFEPGAFMKWEEIIPKDCVFEWESNGNPSIQDRYGDTLLLVWQQAPSVPSLQLSYRISGELSACAESVHGTWHTILNNQPHAVAVPAIAQMDTAPSSQDLALSEEVAISEVESGPKKAAASSSAPRPHFTVPEPDAGIAFRVQIMACHRDVDQLWFQKHYEFVDQVDAERHDRWIKYTTGSHNDYRQARNARVRIAQAHEFSGPFVTAYLRDERITVQEALLLSQQNWMP